MTKRKWGRADNTFVTLCMKDQVKHTYIHSSVSEGGGGNSGTSFMNIPYEKESSQIREQATCNGLSLSWVFWLDTPKIVFKLSF